MIRNIVIIVCLFVIAGLLVRNTSVLSEKAPAMQDIPTITPLPTNKNNVSEDNINTIITPSPTPTPALKESKGMNCYQSGNNDGSLHCQSYDTWYNPNANADGNSFESIK